MDNILFLNHKLKFMQFKGDLYTAYVGENQKTTLVDIDIIDILEEISNDGIAREELYRIINRKNEKLNVEKVVQCLIEQRFLVEKKVKYEWESNTYGISRIGENEKKAVMDTLESKRLFRYEYQTLETMRRQTYLPCKQLEEKIAKLVGTQFCLVMNSGTSALECAFNILDIGEEDEVICPTYNYIGSALSMLHNSAKPVLCDIDETYMLNPNEVEKFISSKTKAILCTHLQGKMADVVTLRQIADKYGLYLIEDCAQAIGAKTEDRCCGSFGDVACFSFHQHKIISAGEGGAIVMNEKRLYERAIMFSDASRAYMYKDNVNVKPAHNMRMPEINAAIILQQLNYLEEFAMHLRRLYGIFVRKLEMIKQLEFEKLNCLEGCIPQSVYLRCKTAEEAVCFDDFLKKLGIASRVLFSQQEINTNIFLWWPCIAERMSMEQEKEKHAKTLGLLSKTISISLGMNISETEVINLCDDIAMYFNDVRNEND